MIYFKKIVSDIEGTSEFHLVFDQKQNFFEINSQNKYFILQYISSHFSYGNISSKTLIEVKGMYIKHDILKHYSVAHQKY